MLKRDLSIYGLIIEIVYINLSNKEKDKSILNKIKFF
jgi:hypothetical protein